MSQDPLHALFEAGEEQGCVNLSYLNEIVTELELGHDLVEVGQVDAALLFSSLEQGVERVLAHLVPIDGGGPTQTAAVPSATAGFRLSRRDGEESRLGRGLRPHLPNWGHDGLV